MTCRSITGKFSYLLFFAGVAILVGCGVVLLQAHLRQQQARQQFNVALLTAPAVARLSKPTKADFTEPVAKTAAKNGSVLGELEIPRLGVDTLIFQGDDAQILRWGTGHIPGTPMPDSLRGNIGLAAHRDSYFRPLRNVRRNDLIIVKTLRGAQQYAVQSTKIVTPDDVGVLDNTSQPTLTLVTCYPFYYVGSAPKRFIVQARAINSAASGSN
ncbi:MAG TPA: class D sortase [Candidatus Acidoferrales bacterium]|jgi:sortase A|nr:class D sortase [Candidatus Acidoferrales bacterium]